MSEVKEKIRFYIKLEHQFSIYTRLQIKMKPCHIKFNQIKPKSLNVSNLLALNVCKINV